MAILVFLLGAALVALPALLALRRLAAAYGSAAAERDGAARELAAVQAELDVERRSFDEKVVNAIKAVSSDALRENNQAFLELAGTKLQGYVAPLKESLEKVDGQVRLLERARQQQFGALRQELVAVREGQDRLRAATGALSTALRTPHVRGRWGEVQLRRVVEAAGMVEHCDFVVQASTRDDEGLLLRPDLVVRLPGGKQVVVDAKVPLLAYLDACEAEDDAEARARLLGEHARQVRDHIGKLAQKAYWRQFAPTPDFVIMFLPDESFLRAAQEHDRELLEYAWGANVVPASPTNLFSLLRTVAATWQQETVAESAREVHALGQELYDRLGTMADHFGRVGKALESAVGHYNRTVGTLETRVLVTGRKLQQHGMAGDDLAQAAPVGERVRPLTAPELVAGQDVQPELPAADAA
jgi:DNA recombination protein RmuC